MLVSLSPPINTGKLRCPHLLRYDGLLEEEEEFQVDTAVAEVCRRGFVAVLLTPIKDKKSKRQGDPSNDKANSENQVRFIEERDCFHIN